MRRLFKRRDSDPNPQLESVSSLSENEEIIEYSIKPTYNDEFGSSKITSKSTWGSRAWDKLKKQNSSEILPTYKAKKYDESTMRQKITNEDVKKVYDMYKNVNAALSTEGELRNTLRTKRKMKCMSDNLELNQSQLMEYLKLMDPSSEQLDKIFDDEEDAALESKKKNRRSRFKSMFTIRSSSKSDDEGEGFRKLDNQRSSSTDSLTSFLNYIMPKKKTAKAKMKSDESGYGSDSAKPVIDSPVGSVKSQISQTSHEVDTDGEADRTLVVKNGHAYREHVGSSDETESADEDMEMETTYSFSKFYGRSPRKPVTKKRTRSQSKDDELARNVVKRRSIKQKSSPMKMCVDEDMEQCSHGVQNIKISDSPLKNHCNVTNVVEKEFKCVKLKMRRNEMVGIKISPSGGDDGTSTYTITEIVPNSVASKNGTLKVGDEVVRANGMRIKGLQYQTAKSHFHPKNNELELVISRASRKAPAKRTNSFKMFLSKPLLSPMKKKPAPYDHLKSGITKASVCKSASKSSIASSINTITPVETSTPKKHYSVTLSKTAVRTPPKKSPKKFVGLSDILDNDSSLETQVTFSGNPLSKPKDPFICPKEVTKGKSSVFLKPQSIPIAKKANSTKNQSNETPTSGGSSPSVSPKVSPSLYGMRKFSLSSATRTQGSKAIPIPSKPSTKISDKTVTFCKGPGKKSLGFSVVGGKDSPKGPIGIYVKTVFKEGQAAESGVLHEGDELLSINGKSFQDLSHLEAVALFKNIKCGEVLIEVVSRPFRLYSHSM
ncbi:inaD-like protein isoform X2 [Euwallacea fornicatus]